MKNTIKNSVSVTLNEKKAGIELTFTDKPSEEVRTALKNVGCKFAKAAKDGHAKKFWWVKDTPETRKALRDALKGVGIDISIPRKQAAKPEKPEKASAKPATKKASPAKGNDAKIAALLKQQIALNEQLLTLLNA